MSGMISSRYLHLFVVVVEGLVERIQYIDSTLLLEHLLDTPRHSTTHIMVSRKLESSNALVIIIHFSQNVVLSENFLSGETSVTNKRMLLFLQKSFLLLVSRENDGISQHTKS